MKVWHCSLLMLVFAVAPIQAQEDKPAAEAAPPEMSAEMQAMMAAYEKASTAGPQHSQVAEHFAGEWTAEQSMWMDPAADPMVNTGKATYTHVLNSKHVRMDYQGSFMGAPFNGISYCGYDNVTGKYYSTWVDDMGTGFMLAHGDYDAATRSYTFRGAIADPLQGGAMMAIREVVRIVDADKHVFEWYETKDGKEIKTMEIVYTRVK